jgi:hypothetical protein
LAPSSPSILSTVLPITLRGWPASSSLLNSMSGLGRITSGEIFFKLPLHVSDRLVRPASRVLAFWDDLEQRLGADGYLPREWPIMSED